MQEFVDSTLLASVARLAVTLRNYPLVREGARLAAVRRGQWFVRHDRERHAEE
jgi:hypothetical protein